MSIIACGDTHIGMKRKTNQDSIGLDDGLKFYVVADGMGGHNGGDIASQMSVKLLPEFIQKNQQKYNTSELLDEAVHFVNSQIYQHGQENTELEGMGTTISAIMFKDNELCVANVGDSRVYLFQNERLYQLTRDNSLVQERLNAGFYDREGARKDPQKNVLIKTVGFELGIRPDLYRYKIAKNDIFLICSDGLHGKVADQDMLFLLKKHLTKPEQITKNHISTAVADLIKLANQNGGQDNISVILAAAK